MDAQPLAAQYESLRGALLAFLRRQVGDAAAAEDLLHDVMVKALVAEGRDGAQARRNPGGWLYTIARNAAIDYLRARRPSAPLPEELTAPAGDDERPPDDLLQCVREITDRLPPLYRDALRAADFDEVPLRELAEAEGVSVSAIKSRVSRGRRLLHEELVCCCKVALADWDGLPMGEALSRCGACPPD
jgi:RNA polymerase sigma-70 factor (ECF subfamily)